MIVVFMINYSFSRRRCLYRQRYALGDQLYDSKDQVSSVF
jgi:hypothetical protein